MRDFFYNKNDVIVAVVIVIIAAFVIYMRVGVIMDYPARAAGAEERTFLQSVLWWDKNADRVISPKSPDESTVQNPVVEAPVQTEVVTPVEDPAPTPDPGQSTVPQEVPQDPVVTDPPAEVVPDPPAEQPTTPSTEVSITVVAGDVGSTIGDKLVSAGAITDKAAFLAEVDAQNAATKLKQGTFKIPAGSTMADIVKILVG